MNIGQIIKRVRKAAGINQEVLGDHLDLAASGVSRLERGVHSMAVDQLTAVGKAVGVPGWAMLREAETGETPDAATSPTLNDAPLNDTMETVVDLMRGIPPHLQERVEEAAREAVRAHIAESHQKLQRRTTSHEARTAKAIEETDTRER